MRTQSPIVLLLLAIYLSTGSTSVAAQVYAEDDDEDDLPASLNAGAPVESEDDIGKDFDGGLLNESEDDFDELDDDFESDSFEEAAIGDDDNAPEATLASFVNNQDSPVWLFHVAGDSETQLTSIPSGDTRSMNTAPGERFIMRAGPEEDDASLAEFTTTVAEIQQYILTADGRAITPEDGGRVHVTFKNDGVEPVWLFFDSTEEAKEKEMQKILPAGQYAMICYIGHHFVSRLGQESTDALARRVTIGYEREQVIDVSPETRERAADEL